MSNTHPDREPQQELTLTGFWTGVFDSDDLSFDATPFHAYLKEEGGMVTGECIEPNGFSSDPLTELFASVEGWLEDREFEFIKTYENAAGAEFSVRYEGALDEARQRIRGVWKVLEGGTPAKRVARSGPFIMDRAPVKLHSTFAGSADRRRFL